MSFASPEPGRCPPDRARVLLADPPGIGRVGLAAVVSAIPGVALVANVFAAEEIEPAVLATNPDVVVMDDRLLRDERRLESWIAALLIVVGVGDDPGYAARARRLGARAWIPKEHADTLLPPMLTAGRGGPSSSPSPAHPRHDA